MKTLKLNHELAQLVRRGVKTSTWRIFDDKDIRAGDMLQLIDKVDPTDESSWTSVGNALVVKTT